MTWMQRCVRMQCVWFILRSHAIMPTNRQKIHFSLARARYMENVVPSKSWTVPVKTFGNRMWSLVSDHMIVCLCPVRTTYIQVGTNSVYVDFNSTSKPDLIISRWHIESNRLQLSINLNSGVFS